MEGPVDTRVASQISIFCGSVLRQPRFYLDINYNCGRIIELSTGWKQYLCHLRDFKYFLDKDFFLTVPNAISHSPFR